MLRTAILCFLTLSSLSALRAEDRPTVGAIPKARQSIKIDGALDDWEGAFVTPLNATHPDFFNRATHVYYLWDDQALYIGVRALDTDPTHISPDTALYDGDAIEFYFDTREGAALGNPEFQPRTLHMFFTAVTGHELKPRWHLRDLPVFKDLKLQGVEMAAAKTADGYTLEFKLPWSNFPGFTPKAGTALGIDVEMGSADGGHRVHRTFAYSSPQSVQTPATFGRVLLVDKLAPGTPYTYSRALMPLDAQVPGNYGWIYATACLSPTVAKQIDKVAARLLDGDMRVRKSAQNVSIKTISGHWTLARCDIETFDVPPGTYTLLVSATAPGGQTIVERAMKIVLPPAP